MDHKIFLQEPFNSFVKTTLSCPASYESKQKNTFRLEVKEVYQTQVKPKGCSADEELVEVLTAISVVSKRLARNLSLLAGQSKSKEGEKPDEQNERDVRDHRIAAKVCYCYQRRG